MAFHKLVAQFVIYGGQIVGRSIIRAWSEAEVRAQATNAATRFGNTITSNINTSLNQKISFLEAQKILGLSEKPTMTEVERSFQRHFHGNEQNPNGIGGSVYLQGKILAARNRMEQAIKNGEIPS